jgi:sugar phosphate isomerase/epimerase
MNMTEDLGRWIGISTLALQDMPLSVAIERAAEAGFQVFELVPRLYGGPEHLRGQARRDLRSQLARFDSVTVHSSGPSLPDGRRVNIASPDGECRRQSVEHYLGHVRLALELGAEVVTLHPGRGLGGYPPSQVRAANLAFAERAIDEAGDEDLRMGYEYFDLELTREIGHGNFGLLFDVGHAALERESDITRGILKSMEELFPHILQFHVHGVRFLEEGGKQDHLPLRANDVIDYAQVIQAMKIQRFAGPVVFEIENSDKIENLSNSVLGRSELLDLWREAK